MSTRRKITAVILALVFVLTTAVPAIAASPTNSECEARANRLYALGLFKGVSTTAIDFDLYRAPTRNEALVMLIRLLGKEAAATSGSYSIPFTDVADWMIPYVGYAYKTGLTKGISPTEFGGSNIVKTQDYLTFVLRALGYNDTEGTTTGVDFTWSNPFTLASSLGLTDGAYTASTSLFERKDVVYISYNALTSKVKGSNNTLLNKLVYVDGAVKSSSVTSAGMSSVVSTTSERVNLSRETVSLNRGATATITASVEPSYAASRSVTWRSSNTSVATVSTSGVVTGVAAGVTTVYAEASDGGASAYAVVKVTDSSAPSDSLTLEFANTSVYLKGGTSAYFPYETYPAGKSAASLYWASSDTSVFTVNSSTGLVTAKTPVTEKTATLYVRPSSSSTTSLATLQVTVYPSDSKNVYKDAVSYPTSVSISASSETITAGTTEKLAFTLSPSSANRTDLTWSSSNASVATVTDGGYVTGVAEGTATITVSGKNASGSVVSDTCTVTVTGGTVSAVEQVNFAFSTYSVVGGNSLTLSNIAYTSLGSYRNTQTYRAYPVSAGSTGLYWTSSNPAVASVNASTGSVRITTTPVTASTQVIITVYKSSAATAANQIGQFMLYVVPNGTSLNNTRVPVTGITMASTALVAAGDTVRAAIYYITPSNGDFTRVRWGTSNPSVASVSEGGYITGITNGTATITAYNESNIAIGSLTVTVSGVSSRLAFNETAYYVVQGTTLTLPHTRPANLADSQITWSSSNSNYATVTSGGVVTALASAASTVTVNITARDTVSNVSATCTLYIVPANLAPSQTVNSAQVQSPVEITAGTTVDIPFTYIDNQYYKSTIRWESLNTAVAYVKNSKLVGVAYGTTYITGYSASNNILCSFIVNVADANSFYTSLTYRTTPDTTMNVGDRQTLSFTMSSAAALNKNFTWYSDNTSVIAVTDATTAPKLTALAVGTASVYAKNGNNVEITGSRKTFTVSAPEVYTSATITTNAEIQQSTGYFVTYVNSAVDFSYTCVPASVTYPAVTAKVVTVSGVSPVAEVTVMPNGSTFSVTGKNVGTATVELYNSANNKIGSVTLAVVSSSVYNSVTFTASPYTFTAPDDFSSKTETISFVTNPINLSGTSTDSFYFTSSDTSYVSISGAGSSASNKITPTAGTASVSLEIKKATVTPITITAYNSLNKIMGTAIINVTAPVVTGVTINGAPQSPITAGKTAALTGTVTPTSGDTSGFIWRSSNPNVASVEYVGNTATVIGVSAGTASIYYGNGNSGASVEVRVAYDTINTVTPTGGTNATVTVGGTTTVTYSINTQNGGKFDPATVLTAESSNPALATVSNPVISSDARSLTVTVTGIAATTAGSGYGQQSNAPTITIKGGGMNLNSGVRVTVNAPAGT